ncbi:MAG: type II toxin-antitoxin system antitoxin SocA domain-containing protein [Candidatus Woesearchaeota archaeon]|jgi:uncharacterized phage-associated protein
MEKKQNNEKTYNVNDVCDYVINRLNAENNDDSLNSLKIQKLLYYIQAWHYAFFKKPVINGTFEAWVHGPVNRTIYDRFKDRMLFFPIDVHDIINTEVDKKIGSDDKAHIDSVLEVYSKYSGVELERMTHQEKPWINARKDFTPNERCDKPIDPEIMGAYYKARLNG